jgi:S-adenosylmethionine:tRNA ribosyltransferase-isomerase
MAGGALTADYDYDLPPERIAQYPAAQRDESRLLVVHRASGRIEHRTFRDIVELIPPGDALVLNTSRVIRARLLGERDCGAPGEVLLLEPRDDGTWEAMVRPGSKLRPGRHLRLGPETTVAVLPGAGERSRLVRFESSLEFDEILERYGHVPLPPYINRADAPQDAERYQTVYAREAGSVAAPTAGLHFTPALLDAIVTKGVARADLTLHVGAGTFKPVQSDNPGEHRMHTERFSLSEDAAATLNAARDAGKHIWAVGTTTLRVLETAVGPDGRFAPKNGTTDIFIRPPHIVHGADRLVTNFHLPRSTLLMLVAAFAGYELTRRVYEVALAEGYRFYSYGDAMCVV